MMPVSGASAKLLRTLARRRPRGGKAALTRNQHEILIAPEHNHVLVDFLAYDKDNNLLEPPFILAKTHSLRPARSSMLVRA
jgi:hypothetical protein